MEVHQQLLLALGVGYLHIHYFFTQAPLGTCVCRERKIERGGGGGGEWGEESEITLGLS